jgi:hypothetical protein
MVFDASAVPRNRTAFLAWYDRQTAWLAGIDYNDPNVPCPGLRAWFQDMIWTFPPMNGPLADRDNVSDQLTDYSLAPTCIYASFRWSEAENARLMAMELAEKHELGFFDLSRADPEIWLPVRRGQLEPMQE